MKNIFLAGILTFISNLSFANQPVCQVDVFFTQSCASQRFLHRSNCGLNSYGQHWAQGCMSTFISQAQWQSQVRFELYRPGQSKYFGQGAITYFLVQYDPMSCWGSIEIDPNYAIQLGIQTSPRRVQKLYGALDFRRSYNVLVNLNRGIGLQYLP